MKWIITRVSVINKCGVLVSKSFDIDLVKSSIRLSQIVGERIRIVRRTGNKYFALCPFHSEKTPSFSIDDSSGLFYCFGCGAKGDVITFLSMYENIPFKDALIKLADIGGVLLRTDLEENNALYDALEAACKFFERNLDSNTIAYLNSRGISNEFIRKFRIGVAPQFGFKKYMQYIRSDILVNAGLLRKDGSEYFNSRIMFPIFDHRNRVIAFGGRKMVENQIAKYMNSPECVLFKKSRVLYGLNFANESIKKKNSVILVEGYLDVIAMQQNGIANTIANLGTSISIEQIHNLSKISSEIIFCMDGDEAGKRAIQRVAFLLLEVINPEFMVKFTYLPEGKDPNDILANGAVEDLVGLIQNSITHYEVLFNLEVSKFNPVSIEDFIKLEGSLFEIIRLIKNRIIAGNYRSFFKSKIYELKGKVFFRSKNDVQRNITGNKVQYNSHSVIARPHALELDLMQDLLIILITKFPKIITRENVVRLKKIDITNLDCKKILDTVLGYESLWAAKSGDLVKYIIDNKLQNELKVVYDRVKTKHLFDKLQIKKASSIESVFLLIMTMCELRSLRARISKLKISICNLGTSGGESEARKELSILNDLQKKEILLIEEEQALRKKFSQML